MSEHKGGGAPSWIVTFADLMALLLTFFVLLLSFSDMDKEKYKTLAESMARAFGAPPAVFGDHPGGMIELPRPGPGEIERPRINDPKATTDDLQRTLAPEMARRDVVIQRQGEEVVIRFPERVAFPVGDARLTPPIQAMLDKIAPLLQRHPGPIVVVGHSDDLPIHNPRYRSNWDLSAARAVSVVHHLLQRLDIPPERLTAQAQADTRPLHPNDSPEHRAANRRVELILKPAMELKK